MARATKDDHAAPDAAAAKPLNNSCLPSIVQVAKQLGQLIPSDELSMLPRDLSSQIDHYVYGTPKI